MSYNESLASSSNLPSMSQSEWEAAPFNQEDTPEKEFNVTVSQSLSKDMQVHTDCYNPEYIDADGYIHADTTDTAWEKVFEENNCHTPLQLIQLLKEVLQKDLEHGIIFKTPAFTQKVITECEGWIDDETNIFES